MTQLDQADPLQKPGAQPLATGTRFAVRAPGADEVTVCLYDSHDRETARHPLRMNASGLFGAFVPDLQAGARYGLRASGPWLPEQGHRFDPAKLLVDPFAVRLDRPFAYDPSLTRFGEDTARLVPKAIVETPLPPLNPGKPWFDPGGLIYELPVRAFTRLHPEVPESDRGTLRALTHPVILDHLRSLCVSAVELMPVVAWIDERHLPPLGLSNAWGYNPVTMMALDPRLAPGGIGDLRDAVAALHGAGIGVILDVVFNHTGESDADGPTLSLRGLGNAAYYRHDPQDPGRLVNDTGCGNTLACDRPEVQELVLATMRHFVIQAGIDGFRFDLAPILGRLQSGFSASADMLQAIVDDPVLHDRLLIAEPWDIGPGGYQLGNFGAPWLEWNDRARDDMRRFWRGDAGTAGALATRLAGSSDVFRHDRLMKTRSVNFIAAHDGFPLGDLVIYARKHNQDNGEDNRDGHDANHSWNHGVEGPTDNPEISSRREADARALLATLFCSRGAIMLTAGDEFGHSQGGNNNAYAQDNAVTWRDWRDLNQGRLAFTRAWAQLRANSAALRRLGFLADAGAGENPDQVAWLAVEGRAMTPGDWDNPDCGAFVMVLGAPGNRLAVLFNRTPDALEPVLPSTRGKWRLAVPEMEGNREHGETTGAGRSVTAWLETGD